MEKTTDRATQSMIDEAEKRGIPLVWDRFAAQLPQCGFGELGLCCRHCMQGPCRIDPFGDGPQRGVCGADRDTFVARGLGRAVAAGTASHGGHARHMAHILLKSAKGQAPDYPIRDEAKLRQVATRIGVAVEGRGTAEIALEVAQLAMAEFSEKDTPLLWAATAVTKGRVETFIKYGVVPTGIDSPVAEMMHRTTYGVDADPVNLLLGTVKCALADFGACHLATDLADILFGTPQPVVTKANLGVLKKDAVNIALHGHNPLLSDVVVQVSEDLELVAAAKKAGAPAGLNVVGICCTGNEIMVRHGIPLATSSVSQETAIVTGVLDALVVDYQCIMPALASVAECYHTKLITTMPIAKIPGATHMEFTPDKARETAREIIRTAIEAFSRRDPDKIRIPQETNAAIVGFSAEAVVAALALVNPEDPLKPLIDNIVNGNIYGICLFAGCNTVKIAQDANYIEMVKRLAAKNVLILATGCASGAFARQGFMTQEATRSYAGDGLKAVLTAIGEAAGLAGPLPLVLHMGSCVDNTRAADVAVAVANKLGVDLDRLPVVASAPEPVTEKAVAIGTWAVAAGLPTHLGLAPPVLGSKTVTTVLTSTVKDLFGGYFMVEPDPGKAADLLLATLSSRRTGLGLSA
ncbi:MAG: carbon-monoxide dehydrogenase catalytic subunit [Deltaproteobacteria bacterium RIFOXYD12_FULL_50_9]|nr:MAG: carbon-monoxide dehydrogenase catalytic subunit [Deltaproteobacteria bacterium RIFOXYD12_FULL_50_9]